jgi:hypothetical protein
MSNGGAHAVHLAHVDDGSDHGSVPRSFAWEVVPCATVEIASPSLWRSAAVLLMEERHAIGLALEERAEGEE